MTAALSGVAGWLVTPFAVLWAATVFAVASIAAVGTIDPGRIDHNLARGVDDGHRRERAAGGGLRTILTCRRLLLFTLSITLFHFASLLSCHWPASGWRKVGVAEPAHSGWPPASS